MSGYANGHDVRPIVMPVSGLDPGIATGIQGFEAPKSAALDCRFRAGNDDRGVIDWAVGNGCQDLHPEASDGPAGVASCTPVHANWSRAAFSRGAAKSTKARILGATSRA